MIPSQELPQQSCCCCFLEPKNPQKTSKRIPKKPHFRYVDYDNQRKAQRIQVKFWKLHSCDLSQFSPELKFSIGVEGLLVGRFEGREDFEKTLKCPTIKRSLKFTKRIKFSSEMTFRNRSLIKLCKTLKLEALSISIPTLDEISMRLAKAIMNPGLKYCSLLYESFSAFLDPKLVSSFRRLRKSNLFLRFFHNNFKILLDTEKLLPWKALSQISQINFPEISNQAIFLPLQSIKSISYQCDNEFGRSFKYELPKLPNLQRLEFYWNTFDPSPSIMNLSFVKQYLNLRSLTIKLLNRETETLDFLSDLPHLRALFLCFEQSPSLHKPLRRNFPDLTKLEKFGLWLDEPILFSFENIKSFIYKNRELKHLDLSLKIQNIGPILEESGNMPLPNIENLRLDLIRCERPFTDSANKIVKALRSLGSLKKLQIEFTENFAELNKILLKESLASIKSLEGLTLKYFKLGNPEPGLHNF